MRLVVAEELVRASEERLQFWRQLKDVAATQAPVDEAVVAERVRADLMQRISASLGFNGGDARRLPAMAAAPARAPAAATTPSSPRWRPIAATAAAAADYEPCWVETPECTACGECVTLAPGVFAYNAERKAVVIDPKGGEIRRHREERREMRRRMPASRRTPWNPAEPGLDQLRGARRELQLRPR